MASRIISNPARVYDYVSRIMPMHMTEGMKGIGWERDGELVAGALYEWFNGQNMWVHLASHLPGRWLSRKFLWYGFYYPFVECGVQRLSAYVRESNAAAVQFNTRLGYEIEARLKGASSDGSDLIVFVMWRDKCPFLGGRYGER